MFSNKTLLISAFVLFTSTGCANLENEAQQKQIINLQGDLVQAQETNQKTQAELTKVRETLATCENKNSDLDILLMAAKTQLQEPKPQLQEQKPKVKAVKHKNITRFQDKTMLGQTEWVYISTLKMSYRGRIDTGAESSSINAIDLEEFERDGEKWLRFKLLGETGDNPQPIEAKIKRFVKIIQASKPGETTRRPVILLHVRIGDIEHLTEFTLTDRQHMEYPVLIGRTFIQDVILVDVSKEYIHPKYHPKTN
jgi:hypothetical protein